jgi:hypothetical protein
MLPVQYTGAAREQGETRALTCMRAAQSGAGKDAAGEVHRRGPRGRERHRWRLRGVILKVGEVCILMPEVSTLMLGRGDEPSSHRDGADQRSGWGYRR